MQTAGYDAVASAAGAGRSSEGVPVRSRRSSAETQRGQNWVPAPRRSSSSASSAGRDVLAREAVRIARPVEALVVMADGRHRVVQEAEPVDDARAFVGMPLHE